MKVPTFQGNWTPPTNYLMDLTLRDHFAGLALQGICATGPYATYSNEALAKWAYDLAAAMIKARGEKNG